MFELAFSLFDYFIKLVEKKEGNLDEYFEIYVKPAYETSEKVFSDYINLLHTVRNKIQQGTKKREIIKFLESGRLKYLPLRWQLYADVTSREADFRRLPKFEKGVLGILMGGQLMFGMDSKYYTPYHHGHTLLYLIEHYLDVETKFDKESRARRITEVSEQIAALEKAWQDVTEGYAEYKLLVIEKPARTKKLLTELTESNKKKIYKYKDEGG